MSYICLGIEIIQKDILYIYISLYSNRDILFCLGLGVVKTLWRKNTPGDLILGKGNFPGEVGLLWLGSQSR